MATFTPRPPAAALTVTRRPREMTLDGGTISSNGAALYRVYARRNPDGTLSIESANNPRAVRGFFDIMRKAQADLDLAAKGELRDVEGESVQPVDYDLKLAVAPLGPGSTLRIGSVNQAHATSQLSITLCRSGKCELPIVPAGVLPKAVLKDAASVNWLMANAVLANRAGAVATESDIDEA